MRHDEEEDAATDASAGPRPKREIMLEASEHAVRALTLEVLVDVRDALDGIHDRLLEMHFDDEPDAEEPSER